MVWHQDRPSEEERDWDRLETDLGSSLQGILGSQRPQERSRSGVSIDSEWTCPLGPQTLYIMKRDSQTEPSKGPGQGAPLAESQRQYWSACSQSGGEGHAHFHILQHPWKGSLVPSMNCSTNISPIHPSEFFLATSYSHAWYCCWEAPIKLISWFQKFPLTSHHFIQLITMEWLRPFLDLKVCPQKEAMRIQFKYTY